MLSCLTLAGIQETRPVWNRRDSTQIRLSQLTRLPGAYQGKAAVLRARELVGLPGLGSRQARHFLFLVQEVQRFKLSEQNFTPQFL